MAQYLDKTGLTTLWSKIKALIPTRTASNGAHAETASGTTANAPTAGMKYNNGMYMTQNYGDNTTPAAYGNIINVAGSGTGQLLLGWSGNDSTTDNIYYRSHRDTSTGGWGAWKRLAYANEIPASLKNPNALTIQNNDTTVATYDGSSAKTINIAPSAIGAAASNHTHSYLPLSGGTLTGDLKMSDGHIYVNGYIEIEDLISCRDRLDVEGDTKLAQLCTFSNTEAHFGVNSSYTDPYKGLTAGFKFGGSIAATGAYVNGDVKAKNIIVNGGNLSFIVNGTTYKLNMGAAVTLGLVTT